MESTTARATGPDDGAPRNEARLPVRPDAIVRARALVRGEAGRAGLAEDRVDDLLIAVSEACTNAMESLHRSDVTDPIEVVCRREGSWFAVLVTDHGSGFDPSALPVRPPVADPDHLAIERGWGVQLMHELVDDLSFDVSGRGVCVRLRMQL